MSDITITPPSRPSITVGDGDMGTDDHRDLDHRDATDSHPISAITGLQAALDAASGGNGLPDGGTVGQVVTNTAPGEGAWADPSGAVDSVNGQTGVVVVDPDDLDDTATAHKFVTAAEKTKLANTSGTNTGDQDLSGYLPTASAAELIRDTIGTALTAGARITLTVADPGDTITVAVSGLVAADLSDFAESVDDRVAALLAAGTGIGLAYNDPSGALTISVSGLTSASLSDFAEAVQDQIGAHVKAGTLLSVAYDDAGTGDTTLSVDTAALDERIRDTIGTALVAGSGVSLTVNDAGDTITIAVSGLVSDAAYDATTWDGVTTVAPSKNAVRDKIEALDSAKQAGPLTGDVTTSGAAATLATVYSGSSSVGSATAVPVLTIDGKGRITATSTATPTVADPPTVQIIARQILK